MSQMTKELFLYRHITLCNQNMLIETFTDYKSNLLKHLCCTNSIKNLLNYRKLERSFASARSVTNYKNI